MLEQVLDFAAEYPVWALTAGAVILLYALAAIYYGLTRHRQKETPARHTQSEQQTQQEPPAPARSPAPAAPAPPPPDSIPQTADRPPDAAPPSPKRSEEPAAPEQTRGLGRPNYEAAGLPYVTVTVHYATDRNEVSPDAAPNERFGEKRATPTPGASPVSYGTCDVAIPKTHKVGRLEEPGWFETEAPDRHVMILSLDRQSPEVFFTTLADRLADMRQAFIFVHGFNVSFKNAARRTAQIAYDLRFEGVPVFYSWPTAVVGQSSLSPTAYTEAENNAIWAQYHFADFLLDMIRRAKPEVLHIAAHSMGNRIVTDALIDIAPLLTAEERSVLREIVLTAPDIDAETFTSHIAPRLTTIVPRVSLYASDNDQALALSQSLHHLPRIGLTSAAIPMPVKGIEVIDATTANTDYFGHNYYGEAEAIIADIFLATRASKSAAERTVTLITHDDAHWTVRNEATVEAAWRSLSVS